VKQGTLAAAVTFVAMLASACATHGAVRSASPVPDQARADPSHYLVVTVRNDTRARAVRPGSTPRGYDTVQQYGPSAEALAEVHALEHDYGLRQVSAWPIASLRVHCIMFELPSDASRSGMLARLAHDPRVESVQPLNEFATQAVVTSSEPLPGADSGAVADEPMPYNDPYASLQVTLRELGVVQAQRRSRGVGVRIAVIDTGVDFSHPDIKARVIETHNFVDANAGQFQNDRHGTEVAGVIAAVADNGLGIVGIAPEAHVIALKACWQSPDAARALCNSFTLAQALEAAIVAHADVINLSLAGPADPLLSRLVSQGAQQGILIVGAVPPDGAGASFPAGLESVLAVEAAENSSNNPQHLRAPGREVLTLVPRGHYDFASGSSLAAAEVSGVLALLLSEHPHLSVTQARDLLARTSRRIETSSGTLTSIDACAALSQLLADGKGCTGSQKSVAAAGEKASAGR
jgi:subtilisin family serine protease